jgi:hypothetical protein
MFIYICMYKNKYVYVYTYVYVCVCICIYKHINVYTYVYMYMQGRGVVLPVHVTMNCCENPYFFVLSHLHKIHTLHDLQ